MYLRYLRCFLLRICDSIQHYFIIYFKGLKKKGSFILRDISVARGSISKVAVVSQLLLTSNLATIVPVGIYDALKMYLPLSGKLK